MNSPVSQPLQALEGSSAVFVTSSGTEIGKTYVSECLIDLWRRAGFQIEALKPVISGFDPLDPQSSDTGRLLKAMGRPVTPTEVHRISPWRYKAPLSPDMAAAREGLSVPYNEVLSFCRSAVPASDQPERRLLIEGVGGVMVPLDRSRSVLDLISDLKLPAVVVGGSYLGSLSHTLSACSVLTARGSTVERVVISETPDSEVDLDETCETLRRFLGPVQVEALPFRVRSP